MGSVTVEIDGRSITVEEGINVIEAARRLGIEIPHFCYHPGLQVDGNCRMCLVELEGAPKPQVACNTWVKDGLKVRTDTEQVKKLRRAVLEFLFLNHPLDCSICDQSGECYLQDYYLAHGNYRSRMDLPKDHKRKHIDAGRHVVLDAERCVLCTRCVRFCDDVTHTGELRIVNRGHSSEIALFPGKRLDNPYSLNTVEICPVGALTSKDFRFSWRVWFLKSADSVCAGCSRGCNIFLDHADGRVYRYRTRPNPEVNGYWLCDEGRMSYKSLNDARIHAASGPAGGDEVELLDDLTDAAAARLREAGSVTLLVSPQLANEDLLAARRLAQELGAARVASGSTRPEGEEDEILRRADKHPNRKGCEMLGLPGDLEEAVAAGGDALVVCGEETLAGDPQLLRKAREGFTTLIACVSHAGAVAGAADYVFPIATHAEMDGSFTNFEGRVQSFRTAFPPRGDTLALWRLLPRLSGAGDRGWDSVAAVRRELAAAVPSWKDAWPGEGRPPQAAGAPAEQREG
ncbi:MAG: 2Fe-2S iron-sulfur cluster binding domain-containing protein [Candidatus Eisenbacteria bacterium]|nr:2Fe-2S iron-sulfur cluster binding domain-containing protein [Candidatus Eisenbacteria bacterium]